jgi:hypothetical protein
MPPSETSKIVSEAEKDCGLYFELKAFCCCDLLLHPRAHELSKAIIRFVESTNVWSGDRQTDRQTDRQIDIVQTDKQTNGQTHTHTHTDTRHTDLANSLHNHTIALGLRHGDRAKKPININRK